MEGERQFPTPKLVVLTHTRLSANLSAPKNTNIIIIFDPGNIGDKNMLKPLFQEEVGLSAAA